MAAITTLDPSQNEAENAQKMVQQLRDLFADAPDVGKKALQNVLQELKSQVAEDRKRGPHRLRQWQRFGAHHDRGPRR